MEKIKIKAIVIGCLVDWLSSFAFSMLISLLLGAKAASAGMPDDQVQEFIAGYFKTQQGFIISIIFGFSFTALGGYAAERIAKTGTLINSAFVGSVSIMIGLIYITSAPIIMTVLSLVFSIPAAVLGGFFYTRKFKFF